MLRILCIVGFLALWQAVTGLGLVSDEILVSPLAVARGICELEMEGLPPGAFLHGHILYSLRLVFTGFGLAFLIALPLGILVGASRLARLVLEPVLEFFRPVPPLAWIPLSMLWFGIGFPSACFIIFLGAFFPVFVNTAAGVAHVPAGLIGAAEVLGASRTDIWFKVLLPASVPSILTGVRISLGIAWMTLVAAEFTGTVDGYGLGYMIMTARDLQRIDLVIAGMVVIGFIGIVIEQLLGIVSRRFLHQR